jgi:hypothetical protein
MSRQQLPFWGAFFFTAEKGSRKAKSKTRRTGAGKK